MDKSVRFDILFPSLVSHPLVQFGSCVYFQTSRDGARSRGVTFQQWCDRLTKPKNQIYISQSFKISPVGMCCNKVKESSLIYLFLHSTGLIWYLFLFSSLE